MTGPTFVATPTVPLGRPIEGTPDDLRRAGLWVDGPVWETYFAGAQVGAIQCAIAAFGRAYTIQRKG